MAVTTVAAIEMALAVAARMADLAVCFRDTNRGCRFDRRHALAVFRLIRLPANPKLSFLYICMGQPVDMRAILELAHRFTKISCMKSVLNWLWILDSP